MFTLPGYEIDRTIYSGRHTTLLIGRRLTDSVAVAIKKSAKDTPTAQDRAFLRHEFELLQSLNLPGVVRAYALAEYEGGVALVLEALPGETLDVQLNRGRIGLGEALRIAIAITESVAGVHSRGIVHKDLKPHHIFYNPETRAARLIDFGIATSLEHAEQPARSPEGLEGTLAYISPEQTGRVAIAVDRRSDLYSLGVLFYELFTGALPFATVDPMEMIYCHLARRPIPPHVRAAEVPEPVSNLVMKLLAKQPEDRYQSAYGLRADLHACLRMLEEKGSISGVPIGTRDVSYDLRMPQRLYGRDSERDALLAALGRVRAGETIFVLVSGYSGVGKSALINQIRRMVTQESGRFTAGKFEQLSRNAPYSSLARALGGLVQLVLAQRPEAVADWREQLRRSLGDNVAILSEAVPELTLLLGPPQTVAALGPAESQNRFDAAFEQLVRAFCEPGQALCLLLDDLQWADAASLRLLKVLLGPGGPRGLLLIGAYRDNEVDAAHPLRITMDALRREGAALTEISLLPLGLHDLCRLLADMLTQTPDEIEPLARLVYDKTRGNPFFVGQFVNALYRDGLIRFSIPLSRWQWDLAEIARRDATDNVIAFMAERLKRFPIDTQQALSLAACIGHEFDLGTLSVICERSIRDTAQLLEVALNEGLILALDAELRYATHLEAGAASEAVSHGVYRFLHDRVQQAAYSLIAAADTAVVRLRIGRRLLSRLQLAQEAAGPSAQGGEEHLFDVVDHLNQGRALITAPEERRQLAALNRRAGDLARTRAAFSAAAEYFNAGLEMFDEATDSQELGEALLLGSAEAESLCGRFARAEERFERIERSAGTPLSRARATSLRLKLYQVAGRYREGVGLAERALLALGVALPQSPEEAHAAIGAEVAAIARNLAGRTIEELADAPLATDPHVCAIIDLLVNVAPCAYIGQPEAFPAIALKMVNLSLLHGNTPASCFAYSVYGFMLVAVFNDTQAGHRFSEMSIRLNEKLGDISLRGTLLHLHGDHINFWTKHIRSDFPILERAFLACQQAGDHVYGNYVAFEIIWQHYEAGDALDVVMAASERFAVFARKTHNEAVFQTIRLEQQFVRSLIGNTAAPFTLAAEGFNESESLAIINQANFGCGTAFYHIIQMLLCFRRGELQAAQQAAAAVVPYLGAVMAMPIEATFHFYRVLLRCALAQSGTAEERAEHLETIRGDLARLARWAEHSPETFAAKYLMARAEVARLDGQILAALADYDAAIDAAAASGFPQYQSLANELAAQCYLHLGRVRPALTYLESAARLARRWGALALASLLEARLLKLQPARAALVAEAPAHALVSASQTLTAHEITNRLLDVATVLRAAQAIASEIDMQRLLERVLRIILTNSGAQRGVLVLAQLDEDAPASSEATDFAIVGIASMDPEKVRAGLSLSMEDHGHEVPVSAIRLTSHIREPLFVPDALNDQRFAADPYIVKHQVQSLLCLPLLHQNYLTGVLYLESTAVRDAFSTERTEILRLLCTQVAIAMENARLYARLRGTSAQLREANSRLESDVALRTTELNQANQHLLHRSEQLDQVNQQLQQELQERQRAEQERRAIDQERARLKDEIIRAQEAHLAEVATPLIPIAPEIMVMPLIGTMDAARAQQVLTTALEGAQTHRAQVVILDITGLRHVDTSVAGTLMNAARALRLLGTRAVLTGIRAEVAQTLVGLGVDLTGITTLTNLQSGIAFAYRIIGRTPTH